MSASTASWEPMALQPEDAGRQTDSKQPLAQPSPTLPRGSTGQGRMAALLSCFGLMADIYDFGIINLVRPVLAKEFGNMTPAQDSMITGAAVLGAMVGQIAFGSVADFCGRRVLFISSAALVGVASLGSACAGFLPGFGLNVYTILAIWRFLMGVGIGGEYPLAAASTAENVDVKSSGQALATVFAGMALGGILAPCIVIMLAGPLGLKADLTWRLAFGFGGVLALLVASLRCYYLQETEGWRQATGSLTSSSHSPSEAQEPQADTSGGFAETATALMSMQRALAGTVVSWFLYDIVTYGVGLFTTTIFPAEPGLAAARTVLFINLITLPGFAGAVFVAPRFQLRQVQFLGLMAMCACFALLVALYDVLSHTGYLFLTIFSLQRCFDVMGPGMATFSIPGQIYPTKVRGTAHGLSAAAGKLGAVIGTVIFPSLNALAGLRTVYTFMATMCLAAAIWTLVFVPPYDHITLEKIVALESSSMPLPQQASAAHALLFDGTNETDADRKGYMLTGYGAALFTTTK